MTKYLKTKEGSIEDVAKQMQNKVLESDYQDKFKKELDKAGKPLGQMTGAEKKSFFNKIDKMHKGKNENAMSVADVDRMKKQGMKPAKEGFASDAQRKAAFASGYKEKGKDKKEDLDSKDKPAVTKVIGQLKKAVAAHSGQVKDLEKAMKTESVNETHTTQTAKANAQQRAAGGEKSPISLMKNKSIDEITANNGKTFAQMRAERKQYAARYKAEGDGFVSNIVVNVDGSCNGLQIYSLMLRDKKAGDLVNLLPSDKPKDIYQLVANSVIDKLKEHAKVGKPYAQQWLDYGVKRSTTKRSIISIT